MAPTWLCAITPTQPGVVQLNANAWKRGRNSACCIHRFWKYCDIWMLHDLGMGSEVPVSLSNHRPAWKREALFNRSWESGAWRIQKWLHIGLSIYLLSVTLGFRSLGSHYDGLHYKYNSRRVPLPRFLNYFHQYCVQGELKQLYRWHPKTHCRSPWLCIANA
jgi:hypothetical protein